MAEIVDRINRAARAPGTHASRGCGRWRLRGFVAPGQVEAGRLLDGYPVLGGDTIEREGDAALAVENEWPRPLGVPRQRLVSLVDPSVFVAPTARIGAGCVL